MGDSAAADADTGYTRDATQRVTHPHRDDGPRQMRARRITYAFGMLLLSAIIVVAVTDHFRWTATTGVSTSSVSASGEGYTLEVRYPEVTRPALASPFDIRLEKAGGFEGPVEVAISWDWLEMWDENSWYPSPSSAVGDEDHLVMEFDPPSGDVLRIIYDARIQPAQQSGRSGYVSVIENDVAVVTVRFHTRVLP